MMIEREGSELSLGAQAELLSLSRSSLYYKPIPPTAEEIAVKHRIDEIYTESPFYGSRKITELLRREGVLINRKAVQRHMRAMGIAGITPGPNLSRRAQGHRIFPYLLRNLVIERPNQVWGIDITYIRLLGGWLYLVAIIDWFSRYTVAWELDDTLEMPFVIECVERALSQATPEIWNSDQGSHFTSPLYTDRLQQAGAPHQHGRQRTGAGQHSDRTSLALAQIRRGLSARLRQSERGAAWDRRLLRLLQSSAAASVTRLPDSGGSLFSNSGGSSKADGRNRINHSS